jgi:hypothetical protein
VDAKKNKKLNFLKMDEWVTELIWNHLSRDYGSRINGLYVVSFLGATFAHKRLKENIRTILQQLPKFTLIRPSFHVYYLLHLVGIGFDMKWKDQCPDDYFECDLFTFKRSEYKKHSFKYEVLDDVLGTTCQFHDFWRKGRGKHYHTISRIYARNMKSRDQIYQQIREIYSNWVSGYYTITKILLLELKEIDPEVFELMKTSDPYFTTMGPVSVIFQGDFHRSEMWLLCSLRIGFPKDLRILISKYIKGFL